ncbi:uncharacterized protein NEMAJ01_1218 [Nematocida major]|uniref:uncharacterized protein n=1 Tax=Nematocida major TaxID=1912982 RepID=UPI002007C33D|nr:uncharacterized protein NEMAJ01_1218 [Nematocida major]KAH9386322.1 hypothetical protein NEMAJ01_1218 [Nematocida major]
MGFILSRLYRGPAFFILILKPGSAKTYAVVDEFFGHFLSRFKVTYRHTSEYFTYNKLSSRGKSLSILEMHDENYSSLFWDCVTGMHSIMYFIDILTRENMLEVIGQLKCIKDANQSASILLIIIKNNVETEEYASFKLGLAKALDGINYKIIESSPVMPMGSPMMADQIFQGVSWALNQTE